jgi:hypothetical protein
LPALAFGSHYSVFKERPGTHRLSRCWCRVFRRTVPDVLQVPESLLQTPEGQGGRSDGCVTLSGSCLGVNAQAGRISRGAAPGRTRHQRSGAGPTSGGSSAGLRRPSTAGWAPAALPAFRPPDQVFRTTSGPHRLVACGEPLRSPACHPVSGVQRTFRSRSAPIRAAFWERAPSAVHLDLPLSHV